MEAPAYVPDTALLQSQQGSSDLPLSPGSSQIFAASPEEGEIRYFCTICFKDYAQRQGAWLHIRTAHNPNPKQCFRCEFTYARPYDYRGHLGKEHPDVNPDLILGKAPGSRRRATIVTEHLSQQAPVSPPAVEEEQQNWAGSQPDPSAPPSPAPAGVTGISPPAVSPVDYNWQPIYAEPEQVTTMDEDENAPGTEVVDATAILPSTEEGAEPMNDLDIPLRDPGQIGLPSANSGGSIATYSPSNPDSAQMHYSQFYSPLSDEDIDAAFDSIFTF